MDYVKKHWRGLLVALLFLFGLIFARYGNSALATTGWGMLIGALFCIWLFWLKTPIQAWRAKRTAGGATPPAAGAAAGATPAAATPPATPADAAAAEKAAEAKRKADKESEEKFRQALVYCFSVLVIIVTLGTLTYHVVAYVSGSLVEIEKVKAHEREEWDKAMRALAEKEKAEKAGIPATTPVTSGPATSVAGTTTTLPAIPEGGYEYTAKAGETVGPFDLSSPRVVSVSFGVDKADPNWSSIEGQSFQYIVRYMDGTEETIDSLVGAEVKMQRVKKIKQISVKSTVEFHGLIKPIFNKK